MRRKFSTFLFFILTLALTTSAFADDSLLSKEEFNKQNQNVYYVQKNQSDNILKPEIINISDCQNNYKKECKNLEIEEKKLSKKVLNDKILSESTRKINAIYPNDEPNLNNTYPGYRGPNQLVIYTRDFGKTTGTNEFGKEAVVEDDIVVALTGANSTIPKNGYVISGHGKAKKWISDNLKIGTNIEIVERDIKAYTTIGSYRYYAKTKIDEVEDILISSKANDNTNNKFVYYYLKKAKQQYKKSLKGDSDNSFECAKEAIRTASLAFQYSLPYLEDELKGVWIRPTEKSKDKIQDTLEKIKDAGINNVFLETYFHGKTIYPSKVMEEYGFQEQNPEFNFDALAVWIKEAHKKNMKIHIWFESFYIGNVSPEYNPKSILAIKPEWQNKTKEKADFVGYVYHPQEHNGYFLDPANTEVTDFLLKLIDEISTKYNIDGINVDYVRYPNIQKENYNNQWGYTPFARAEFSYLYGIDPMDIEPKTHMWDNWCDYRKDKITNYIQQISDLLKCKDIIFSTVIFPNYKLSLQTKFQDWDKWIDKKYVNAVTPLILTGDDTLAKHMLEEIRKKSNNNVSIYPGLFAGFIESDSEDLLRQIHIIRKLKLEGVVLFDWAHLKKEYIDVLKTSAFKKQMY